MVGWSVTKRPSLVLLDVLDMHEEVVKSLLSCLVSAAVVKSNKRNKLFEAKLSERKN